jgi:hypothetical protein
MSRRIEALLSAAKNEMPREFEDEWQRQLVIARRFMSNELVRWDITDTDRERMRSMVEGLDPSAEDLREIRSEYARLLEAFIAKVVELRAKSQGLPTGELDTKIKELERSRRTFYGGMAFEFERRFMKARIWNETRAILEDAATKREQGASGGVHSAAAPGSPGPASSPLTQSMARTNSEVREWGIETLRAILADQTRRDQLFNYLKELAKTDPDTAGRVLRLAEGVQHDRAVSLTAEQREDPSRCHFCGRPFAKADGTSDEFGLMKHLLEMHGKEFPI